MSESTYRLGNCQILLATVSYPINHDTDWWRDLAYTIAERAGLHPLEWNAAYYPGGGLTVQWFLSESHITIDTHPEHGLADLTLVSCKAFDIKKALSGCDLTGLAIINTTTLQKRDDHKWRAF